MDEGLPLGTSFSVFVYQRALHLTLGGWKWRGRVRGGPVGDVGPGCDTVAEYLHRVHAVNHDDGERACGGDDEERQNHRSRTFAPCTYTYMPGHRDGKMKGKGRGTCMYGWRMETRGCEYGIYREAGVTPAVWGQRVEAEGGFCICDCWENCVLIVGWVLDGLVRVEDGGDWTAKAW